MPVAPNACGTEMAMKNDAAAATRTAMRTAVCSTSIAFVSQA